MNIIYKPGLSQSIADWLSRQNYNENKDKEITGMQISLNALQSTTIIPKCMTMQGLQEATSQDQYLQCLMEFVIQGWPANKNQLPQNIRTYWTFRDDMAVTDGIVIKGRHIVIPRALQQQVLKQLHINHMGIEKTNILACESVYWICMNTDIENHMKNCSTYLNFQHTQPKEKFIHHDIPGKP